MKYINGGTRSAIQTERFNLQPILLQMLMNPLPMSFLSVGSFPYRLALSEALRNIVLLQPEYLQGML